jgi:hypothetical protein
MKRFLAIAVVVGGLVAPETVQAQEDGNPYVFGTYYQCDQNREAFADMVQEYVMGPILDGHVEAGDLLAWGWLSHRIGGDWRRAEYMIAPDRATLLTVRNAIIEALQEGGEAQQASREMTDICPNHEDYIFSVVASSDPEAVAQARPSVGLSSYYQCDIAREARADEIVLESLAPILNRHVGEGAFGSWIWLAHDVGGKIRRLLALDAADGPTLYAHRDALIADIQNEAADAATEFNEICHTHDDYQWDITISRP